MSKCKCSKDFPEEPFAMLSGKRTRPRRVDGFQSPKRRSKAIRQITQNTHTHTHESHECVYFRYFRSGAPHLAHWIDWMVYTRIVEPSSGSLPGRSLYDLYVDTQIVGLHGRCCTCRAPGGLPTSLLFMSSCFKTPLLKGFRKTWKLLLPGAKVAPERNPFFPTGQ